MNWNDLRVFLAIADTGSLAGAARSLSVNHSTVFRRLNALESDLSVRVFDRLPGGYVLTPVGEKLLERTRVADDAIRQIDFELAGRDLEPEGTVRLTTTIDIARLILPGALRSLRRSHPGIVVEVSVGDSDYDLGRREADIALRATTKPPEQLIGRHVRDLEWWVCASTSWRHKHPKTPAELTGEPLIGADNELMRLPAMQWIEDKHAEQVVARANDLSSMAAMAVAGIGYAVLPSLPEERGLKRLFRIPGVGGALWLLAHPDMRNVRRVRVVWDALVEATAYENAGARR